MVAISTVIASNARFVKEQHRGAVCVFAGATAGIGLETLKKMAVMLNSSTFYILGRTPSRFTSHLEELKMIGPSNQYQFIEAQVSLISEVDAVCQQITSSETKLDYLCMSSGGLPWAGASYTKEGLETCFAVSYYSRLRLVANLLPLLHQAPRPRVLSILNGTREKPINEQDLNLEKSWGVMPVVNHTTLFTSLAFDYLAAHDDHKHLTLIHSSPGLVRTDSPKQKPKREDGWVRWFWVSVVMFFAGIFIRYGAMPLDESGERHAFSLASDTVQSGSRRVDKLSDVRPDNKVLVAYQQRGWAEKIWGYTQGMWDKALAVSS